MGTARITSLYPKFNGSHFALPPSSIHRMTGLDGNFPHTMTYAHKPHFRKSVQFTNLRIFLAYETFSYWADHLTYTRSDSRPKARRCDSTTARNDFSLNLSGRKSFDKNRQGKGEKRRHKNVNTSLERSFSLPDFQTAICQTDFRVLQTFRSILCGFFSGNIILHQRKMKDVQKQKVLLQRIMAAANRQSSI